MSAMEDFGEGNKSDQAVSESHPKFIEAISQLDKKQSVDKPERHEPSSVFSEFNLLYSEVPGANSTKVSSSSGRKEKKIKLLSTPKLKDKALPKPLEKCVAEKQKRIAGFVRVKKDLQKWNAVVTGNRMAEHIHFPINSSLQPIKEFGKRFRIKSDLEKELLASEPTSEDLKEGDDLKLCLEEILQRRAEIARLKAKESYKISKAHRQKKIKSKKFHRIERKSKLKNKLKEQEKSQENGSLEALEKQEHLDKIRSEERMTLRHKNTSQWAKRKLMRAKYDIESRQELNQQLSIGQSITQKSLTTENTDDEEDGSTSVPIPLSFNENPWINQAKPETEVKQFINEYRRYRDNKINSGVETNKVTSYDINETEKPSTNNETNMFAESDQVSKFIEENAIGTSTWMVTDFNKSKEKSKKNSKKIKLDKMLDLKYDKIVNKNLKEVNSKRQILKKDIKMQKSLNVDTPVKQVKKKKNLKKGKDSDDTIQEIKPKYLESQLPDADSVECETLCNNEEDEESNGYQLLHEAFSDEDLIEEFRKEKGEEMEKSKSETIDLSAPGWGSWGGKNIKQPSRKKRQIIFKFPKDANRKEENKGNVILINENNAAIKKHQVADLPFPFTNVKDFEASVRAPIGRNFVPEKIHRRLIKPSVRTKMGKIIEPMNEDVLLKAKNVKIGQNDTII